MLPRPLILLGLALLSIGCFGGAPRRVYVLSTALTAGQSTISDVELPALQVETVSLPSFLDNTSILVRQGTYALESSRTGRWGERLSLGITHTLAADLAPLLPGFRLSSQRSQAAASRRLEVEVDSFDVFADGHCVLTASWSIVEKSGVVSPVSGHGVFETPTSAATHADDPQIVRAMAAATGQLANAIARSL
jgi:uncharacterized lipoprotein YmbA